MLRKLELENVGPAPKLELELGERFNLLTGDNGLGKSFLLDVAWVLTTQIEAGPGPGIAPARGKTGYARAFWTSGNEVETVGSITFGRDGHHSTGPNSISEILLYARFNGGFSIFDPLRNGPGKPPAYDFEASQVWNGLEVDGVSVCEGLERDWVSWQKGNEPQFAALEKVLSRVSPPGEVLKAGPPQRVYLGEGFQRPTILQHGEPLPVVHASAGIRRILALAYLLVWAWHENREAAALLGREPTQSLMLLIDEPETHLHPGWQRVILPALLEASRELWQESAPQFLIATHSPLVLASLETSFDEDLDMLFHLDAHRGKVEVKPQTWAKQGDATNWLVSEAFGLKQARSAEAEKAIEAAEAFMREDWSVLPEGLVTQVQIHNELVRVLAGHDDFWPRWIVRTENGMGVP